MVVSPKISLSSKVKSVHVIIRLINFGNQAIKVEGKYKQKIMQREWVRVSVLFLNRVFFNMSCKNQRPIYCEKANLFQDTLYI